MNSENISRILTGLEHDIEGEAYECPQAMPGDRWLVSSAMQKAIRRGEIERALNAASALWQQDRQSFWRRLHIICLEDVGIGNLDAVIKTLSAVSSFQWRRKIGDERAGLHLTRLLAASDKNRMSEELFTQAERMPGYRGLRENLAKAEDSLLMDYAGHENSPLIERAIALWLLAGTKKYPSDRMPARTGFPEKAAEVIYSLKAPPELIEACISVMGRTSWPLSIFLPLIWQEKQKLPRPLYVFYNPIAVMPDVEGIPLYAADMFTRVGQSSIRQLKKTVQELKQFSPKQIGLALFYTEGCKLNKVLTCEFMESFRQGSETADIEGAGLDLPSYMGLRDALIENMDTFNRIRRRELEKYLGRCNE